MIAGPDTDARDIDVGRCLDALVAIAAIKVAIAASEHIATEQDCRRHYRSYCRSSHRVASPPPRISHVMISESRVDILCWLLPVGSLLDQL